MRGRARLKVGKSTRDSKFAELPRVFLIEKRVRRREIMVIKLVDIRIEPGPRQAHSLFVALSTIIIQSFSLVES